MREFKPSPALPAPQNSVGPLVWIKANLFSSIGNSITTVIILAALLYLVPGIVDWLLISADFRGTTQDDCSKEGACWVFISAWMQQLIYGSYPEQEIWRVNVSLLLLPVLIAAQYFIPKHLRKSAGTLSIVIYPIFCAMLLDGRPLGLEFVATDLWGGFSLNIILATAAIIFSLPISILWALGRRSEMPFIRTVSIIFIEFFRGVPVLALLFMGSVMLQLFFPEGFNVDKLFRTFIVLTLFMAGYMAEVIRGGLQAIPKGQYEAADSLGLGYWQKMGLIILPQAMKISIPNILATFIMLFKNTTFVIIIGLFEILNTVQSALTNSNWLGGHATEGYLFVAAIFWVCCFGMSVISRNLEKTLETGHKR